MQALWAQFLICNQGIMQTISNRIPPIPLIDANSAI